MGWAGLSLRKMILKQRINNLEQRLVNISQEIQTQYDSSSYAQQALGVEKNQALANLQTTFSNNSSVLADSYGNATDASALAEYNNQIQQQQLSLMYNQMLQNSIFSSKEQSMQDTINAAESQLELEQEQVETQLEAARAEYDSLDQAVSQDVKNGAISLVS